MEPFLGESAMSAKPRSEDTDPCLSSKHPLDDDPRVLGQAFIAAIVAIGEPFVIHAEQVQDRRMDIMDVRYLLGGAQADGVRVANGLTGLDAAAGEPHGEAVRI